MGGEGGLTLTLSAGDVVVVPAGVAHKKTASGGRFACVGAYPPGRSPDLCRVNGSSEVAPGHADAVSRVPMPACDPVFGPQGPLLAIWRAA